MPKRWLVALAGLAPLLSFLAAATATAAVAAPACGWREPPRTYPEGVQWTCAATGWTDGDTFTARCDGGAGTVAVRLRGVDTEEHGEGRWLEAREELRRRTAGRPLDVLPHHRSHRRVVADMLAGGANVGTAMDAAGWSKADCPKR